MSVICICIFLYFVIGETLAELGVLPCSCAGGGAVRFRGVRSFSTITR